MNYFSLKASPVRLSLTPGCPYTTSIGEANKYLKQVSNGDLLVEVFIDLLL